MTVLRLHRVVDRHDPSGVHVEIHEPECDCAACAPYRAVAPAEPPALTLPQIGNLVWLGLAIGSAIAFAIDPHGAVQALASIVTGVR